MPTGLSPSVGALLNQSNSLLGLPGLPAGLFKPPVMPGMPTASTGGVSYSPAHGDSSSPLGVIRQWAPKYGLDPAAVMAYALEESNGRWNATGDQGTSFGPFQMHRGGALGNQTAAWAESPAGLIAGMRMMSQTPAKGLTGAAAVRAIYQYFGKGTPAAVPRGLARYAEAQQMLAGSRQNPAVIVDHNQPISPLTAPIIKLAAQYLGTPYVWGGANPQTGFDCSGFVQWLYGQKGVRLPRTTYEQWKVGRPVGRGQLRPGDIIFFNEGDPRGPSHEGLYIGHGQFIQAPHTGDVVRISSVNGQWYAQHFMGARRVI